MRKELTLVAIIIFSAVLYFGLKTQFQKQISNTAIPHSSPASGNITFSPTPETTQNLPQEIPLTISQPGNNSQVTTPNLLVRGKTAANADVMVNDIELTADSQGNFSTSLLLDPGSNFIDVVANDEQGRYAERELTVILQTDSF